MRREAKLSEGHLSAKPEVFLTLSHTPLPPVAPSQTALRRVLLELFNLSSRTAAVSEAHSHGDCRLPCLAPTPPSRAFSPLVFHAATAASFLLPRCLTFASGHRHLVSTALMYMHV